MQESQVPDEVSPQEAHALLAQDGDTILLDVREPHEYTLCRIEGSTHVPLRDLPGKLPNLPRAKHFLVLCHHGGRSGRSRRAVDYLRANGFERVTNVAGGIDNWARTVEPSLTRY